MKLSFNYVAVDNTSLIDRPPGQTSIDCASGSHTCYKMHNGGIVLVHNASNYMGTASNDALVIWYDPDGEYSGSTTGAGKGMHIFIYYNGRITAEDGIVSSTRTFWGNINPDPNDVPDWFSWD